MKQAKQKSRIRHKAADALFQVFCLLLGLLLIAPVLYCLSVSFMEAKEILTTDLHLLPSRLYLGNYINVITKTDIFRYMLNSLIVASVSSIVRIIVCSLASYAFAFFEFKGKKLLFVLVLGAMVVPSDVLVFQNYFTVSRMGLINTYLGMMIVYFIYAANIYVIRQNFKAYSKVLKDAAEVDGCGSLRFFLRILMPSSGPILTTVFISSFVGTWNTYLWPLLVTNVDHMRTAQTAIARLNAADNNAYGVVMAASIIILIPSILIFVLFQRRVVSGMMAGAVKE